MVSGNFSASEQGSVGEFAFSSVSCQTESKPCEDWLILIFIILGNGCIDYQYSLRLSPKNSDKG